MLTLYYYHIGHINAHNNRSISEHHSRLNTNMTIRTELRLEYTCTQSHGITKTLK